MRRSPGAIILKVHHCLIQNKNYIVVFIMYEFIDNYYAFNLHYFRDESGCAFLALPDVAHSRILSFLSVKEMYLIRPVCIANFCISQQLRFHLGFS